MEKYATYKIFKHKLTGDIKRVPHTPDSKGLKKLSEFSEDLWVELDEDPDFKPEDSNGIS